MIFFRKNTEGSEDISKQVEEIISNCNNQFNEMNIEIKNVSNLIDDNFFIFCLSFLFDWNIL